MTDYQISERYWSRQRGCVQHVIAIPVFDETDDDPYGTACPPSVPHHSSVRLALLIGAIIAFADATALLYWYQPNLL